MMEHKKGGDSMQSIAILFANGGSIDIERANDPAPASSFPDPTRSEIAFPLDRYRVTVTGDDRTKAVVIIARDAYDRIVRILRAFGGVS